MSRHHKPGSVELTGTGRAYFVDASGKYVPFDRERFRDARPWARGSRQDTREMVL